MEDLDIDEFHGWFAFTFTKIFYWYSLRFTLHISMGFQDKFSLLIGYLLYTTLCGQVLLACLLILLNEMSQKNG